MIAEYTGTNSCQGFCLGGGGGGEKIPRFVIIRRT